MTANEFHARRAEGTITTAKATPMNKAVWMRLGHATQSKYDEHDQGNPPSEPTLPVGNLYQRGHGGPEQQRQCHKHRHC